jgi:hypothetical protein
MDKNKKRNDMDEKLIDLMWEVKEGKKHPNRAYKELCVLFNVSNQRELLIAGINDYPKKAEQHVGLTVERYVDKYHSNL